MRHKAINEASINDLMEVFYEKIRVDKDLGEIFNHAVGTSDEAWEAHKQKIGGFWSSVLLGSGVYTGNPLQKHFELPPFPREFFSIWLGLFEESLDEIYDEENKIIILQKAQMVANRFMHMLYND
ncbi:group III truncated hemoglobin [Campylobacter fetus subsp. venerealis]|uniref:group III truncated hemoglobin n=1 Tax=Campylobacter fetus TaxID=196 RepID=UPI0018E789B1|nr:group III truncated hemoglobin [Campylobacter fetus]QQF51774.1 group III truncated hemoglobin [Campylobacter fetus subsp. venerealis]